MTNLQDLVVEDLAMALAHVRVPSSTVYMDGSHAPMPSEWRAAREFLEHWLPYLTGTLTHPDVTPEEGKLRSYMITVKIPRNKSHNPTNKITGSCPVQDSHKTCTDVTGEHHTLLVRDVPNNTEALRRMLLKYEWSMHITRIEEV